MKLMITCKQATEFIIKREEKKLSLKTLMLLWLHIGICGVCKIFARQSKFISKNSAQIHNHVTESLTPQEKEQMIKNLEGQ